MKWQIKKKEPFWKLFTCIKGKGIGYVALKNIKIGTLILDEKPQIFTEGIPPESKFFKSLSESFKKLQLNDQEKYLKLYNRFEKTDLLKEISNIQTSGGGWTTSRGVIGEENPFIMDKNQKSPCQFNLLFKENVQLRGI